MSSNDIERVRRQELAAEKAIGGLDQAEWLELQRQAGAPADAFEEAELERAAAAIELARQRPLEPMPRHLLAAIAADADRHFAPGRGTPLRAPVPPAPTLAGVARRVPPAWFAYGGWLAAAASIVAAVGLGVFGRPDAARDAPAVAAITQPATPATVRRENPQRGPGQATLPAAAPSPSAARPEAAAADPAAEREALAAQRFVLRRNWAPAGDPAGRGVEGDVVWDARTQTGYMRFVGLRRNDPSIEQYQLWIFDGRRDQRYPVDGGVFDVRGGDGEVIVPIRARLPVGTPLAFAVTLERSGGVVVSDRGRVVVIARAS